MRRTSRARARTPRARARVGWGGVEALSPGARARRVAAHTNQSPTRAHARENARARPAASVSAFSDNDPPAVPIKARVVRGKSSLSVLGLPEELRNVLRPFDQDMSGDIDLEELTRAGKMYQDSHEERRRLRRRVTILTVLLCLLLLCIFGIMYGAYELTRREDLRDPDGKTDVRGNERAVQGSYDTTKGQPENVLHQGLVDARKLTAELDARKAALEAAEELECLVQLEEISELAYGDPLTALEQGDDDQWLFSFLPGRATEEDVTDLCAALSAFSGECGPTANAAATRVVPATIRRDNVLAFRKAMRFNAITAGKTCEEQSTPFGLQCIDKAVVVRTPAHHRQARLAHHEEHHQNFIAKARRNLAQTRGGRQVALAERRRRALEEAHEAQPMMKEAVDRLMAEHGAAARAHDAHQASLRAGGGNARQLRAIDIPPETAQCYFITDQGTSYRGDTAVAGEGGADPCVHWEDHFGTLTINGATLSSADFPEIGDGDGNLCRNPGDVLGWKRPWCVVDIGGSPSAKPCMIPICEVSAFTASNEPILGRDDWKWALDRLDQGTSDATYDESDGTWKSSVDGTELTGAGTHIIVFDTGVRTSHSEFTGRVGAGADFTVDPPIFTTATTDGNGHGTHVAGAAAGATHGVATQATVHGIKVMGDDGTGTSSTLVNAAAWVHANLATLTNGEPTIVVMSLGMSQSTVMNDMIRCAGGRGSSAMCDGAFRSRERARVATLSAHPLVEV